MSIRDVVESLYAAYEELDSLADAYDSGQSEAYERGKVDGAAEYSYGFHIGDFAAYGAMWLLVLVAGGMLGFLAWHFIHWAAMP